MAIPNLDDRDTMNPSACWDLVTCSLDELWQAVKTVRHRWVPQHEHALDFAYRNRAWVAIATVENVDELRTLCQHIRVAAGMVRRGVLGPAPDADLAARWSGVAMTIHARIAAPAFAIGGTQDATDT